MKRLTLIFLSLLPISSAFAHGMSAEDLKQIGEPFFTTKDAGRGMGLGLFIARLFAERLGGVFRIESFLGKGTTVGIELPRIVAWEASQ